jgi:hypothetical protein
MQEWQKKIPSTLKNDLRLFWGQLLQECQALF